MLDKAFAPTLTADKTHETKKTRCRRAAGDRPGLGPDSLAQPTGRPSNGSSKRHIQSFQPLVLFLRSLPPRSGMAAETIRLRGGPFLGQPRPILTQSCQPPAPPPRPDARTGTVATDQAAPGPRRVRRPTGKPGHPRRPAPTPRPDTPSDRIYAGVLIAVLSGARGWFVRGSGPARQTAIPFSTAAGFDRLQR